MDETRALLLLPSPFLRGQTSKRLQIRHRSRPQLLPPFTRLGGVKKKCLVSQALLAKSATFLDFLTSTIQGTAQFRLEENGYGPKLLSESDENSRLNIEA